MRKNKYFRCSKLSEAKLRQILRYFAMDLTATDCAQLSGVSVRSINSIYLRLRRRMAVECETSLPPSAVVPTDEPDPGQRVSVVLGASRKSMVFGLLQCGDKVYTRIVPDAVARPLQAAIRDKLSVAGLLAGQLGNGYEGVVDMAFNRYLRIKMDSDDRQSRTGHASVAESFWSFAKRRLAQFNGVPRHTFYLHLKETEFRFNHRRENLYAVLLSLLRAHPL